MAKTGVSKEAVDCAATRRRISFFLMVYFHLVTSEHPDEAKAEAPPSPPSSTHPEPESLPHPYSASNSSPNNLVITIAADTTTPSAMPPQNDNGNLHPVIGILREQELGKATLSFAIPITLALLTSNKDKLVKSEMSFILIALSVGCTAIWNGILLRNTFPRCAQVLEPLGIALVFISFNGLVAFLLPAEFLWVPAVCGALSLLPFILAAHHAAPVAPMQPGAS